MAAIAIVTAGGRGVRLGGEEPKQFLPILGVPMIVHTLRAFAKAKTIDGFIVTLPPDRVETFEHDFIRTYDLPKFIRSVPGGETRQASVHQGLRAIDRACDLVVVHDAARCLISSDTIDAAVEHCKGRDGVIVALPVRDSIKKVDDRTIVQTLRRDTLWAMQTPQVFQRALLDRAYAKAEKDGYLATDDAELAERLGAKIEVMEGTASNIKVTYPEDLLFANEWLKKVSS